MKQDNYFIKLPLKEDFLKIINLYRGCKCFVTWCGAIGSTKIVQKYQRGQKLFRNCQKLCWEKIPAISRITSLQVNSKTLLSYLVILLWQYRLWRFVSGNTKLVRFYLRMNVYRGNFGTFWYRMMVWFWKMALFEFNILFWKKK